MESTCKASDGTTLAVRTTLPAGPVRGVVQILHGMAEHAGRYDRLAGELADAGLAVVAHDQRGHGATSPTSLGHVADRDGWGLLVEDALTVGELARAQHPGAPLVLLGHSMGSLVARTLAAKDSRTIDGLVLSGTVALPGRLERVAGLTIARASCRLRGPGRPARLLDRVLNGGFNRAFKPARTSFDWLSRDEAVVDDYIADPAAGFVCSNGFYVDLFTGLGQAFDRGGVASVRSDLPIHLLAGEEDPVGDRGGVVADVAASYRRAGVRDVTTRLYSGGRHEMFNETSREEVVADLIAWIEGHVVAGSQGGDVIPLRRKEIDGDRP